jgi:hypothetical protein
MPPMLIEVRQHTLSNTTTIQWDIKTTTVLFGDQGAYERVLLYALATGPAIV